MWEEERQCVMESDAGREGGGGEVGVVLGGSKAYHDLFVYRCREKEI